MSYREMATQMIARLLFMAILFTIPLASQDARAKVGSIRGSVMESDGNPLQGAIVYALPAEDMTHQIRTKTDESGNFTLSGVPLGDAYISAYDEDKGYPYDFFAFFLLPGQKIKKVTVSADKETTNIVIKLGAKSARLELKIRDSAGTPVAGSVQMVFTRPDLPGEFTQGGGADISMLVPPVPFHLRIRAEGFRQWDYPDQGQVSGGLLTPRSGETIRVTAHLLKQ